MADCYICQLRSPYIGDKVVNIVAHSEELARAQVVARPENRGFEVMQVYAKSTMPTVEAAQTQPDEGIEDGIADMDLDQLMEEAGAC